MPTFLKQKNESKNYLLKVTIPLKLLKSHAAQGMVSIEDDTNSIYKISINDFKDNKSDLSIPIQGLKKQNSLEDRARCS